MTVPAASLDLLLSNAPILIPAITFLAVTVLALALLSGRRHDVRRKLAPFAPPPTGAAGQSPAFAARVVGPLLDRLAALARSATPARSLDRTRAALDQAGNPLTLNGYLALQVLAAALLPVTLAGAWLATSHPFNQLPPLSVVLVAGLGLLALRHWLSASARARQRAIERALPDALDVIVVSMEAGLGFDGAVAQVEEKSRGPLVDELHTMLAEMQLGTSRREALLGLARRTGVKDLTNLVNVLVQADHMGVSMTQVMRTQAADARLRRRQRAEERAHQAGVKMVLPLVLFILPSIIIVTVGPALMTISQQFGHGLGPR